ncbi:MAG: TetR/AcrR family transcriptional regulator [Bauldia sp.]|nr:TetR/AcrR family transcriptional regulator [Bauldia sp.]
MSEPTARTARTKTKPRPRDRQATRRAILFAAKEVLAESGFQEFGVNTVARRAGCDKQLIYRYYGGLEGLVDAIGGELGFWVRDSLRPIAALGPPSSYAELMERLALGFLEALREDPLVQRIVAWEIAAPSPEVQRLATSRSRGLVGWIAEMRGDLAPPEGLDAPAVNAVLVAAIQLLVVAAASTGQFAGLRLKTEKDWERVRAALRILIAAAYA